MWRGGEKRQTARRGGGEEEEEEEGGGAEGSGPRLTRRVEEERRRRLQWRHLRVLGRAQPCAPRRDSAVHPGGPGLRVGVAPGPARHTLTPDTHLRPPRPVVVRRALQRRGGLAQPSRATAATAATAADGRPDVDCTGRWGGETSSRCSRAAGRRDRSWRAPVPDDAARANCAWRTAGDNNGGPRAGSPAAPALLSPPLSVTIPPRRTLAHTSRGTAGRDRQRWDWPPRLPDAAVPGNR